ncbi:hypothetical protein BOTNAR_0048g00050 [Botryotinia narcissicola]|uniref:Zn(2)-C6 fungal-type domain-containing protein n=1 Tax=Botryotinia narcissicola TaxID=278944 RepID=A0A4Z1J080_9HELO|nr:hypothetical protein BOTNAR_0048g00050 [Botryotinia narcissicola]
MELDTMEGKPGCLSCGAKFNHQSSLSRHLKNQCNKNQSRRRKACLQCVVHKTRCSLKRPTCSRCHAREVPCEYAIPENPNTPANVEHELSEIEKDPTSTTTSDISAAFRPQFLQSTFDPNLFDTFFSDAGTWSSMPQLDLDLYPQHTDHLGLSYFGREYEGISELGRLNDVPSIELQPFTKPNSAALANHSMELIFRVFRTWPQMLAEGFQLPPIFHSTHFAQNDALPRPLATCTTLVKMWHGQSVGAEEIVRKTIVSELNLIVDQPEELDETMLLAVLQAVVIYSIILLSPSRAPQNSPDDNEIVFQKVESLVWHVVRDGLFLKEERAQTRPCWKAWIYVASKRRAVLTLYLLHWAHSVLHKVQCFDCKDLGLMPAPAPKVLWQASTEQEWNTKYIHWLSRWSGRIYLQAEIGEILPGTTLNSRAEKWFGEVDEFGFIMASIVNATEFSPPSLKILIQ